MADPTDLFGPEWQLPALIARTGYANELSAQVVGVLDAAYQDVTAKLLTGNLTPAARAELEAFRLFVSDRLNEAFGMAKDVAAKSLTAYGAVEAGVAAGQVNTVLAALGRPSRQQILSTADFSKIVATLDLNGVGFDDWWQASAVNYAQKVQRTVQTGLLQGLNPKAIARQILGDPKAPAAPSIAKNSAAWTRMTVRTAMTAVQTHAAVEEYKALTTGAMLGVRFEAVLDYRTSDVCRAFDNRVYALDDKALPRPPLHPNCRSTLVPVVDTTGAGIWQKNADPGTKRLTAEQWMTKQPAGVQNALLGPKRAQLYRDGKVGLAELIGKDKRRLTLAQLDQYLNDKAAGLAQPPVTPPMPKSQYKAPKTPKAAKAAQTAGPLPSPLSAAPTPASGAAAAVTGTASPVAPATNAVADVIAAAKPGATAPDPLDTYRAWTKKQIGAQGGSNEGGRFLGADGVDRYVKLYSDPEQIYSEVLSARLFRDLGAAAPEFEIAAGPGGKTAIASKWVNGAKNLGLSPDKADARAVLDHIVGDMFTANWDAVGLSGDNILKLADGRLYRVDVGGTFYFRAQAGRKVIDPAVLTEWEGFTLKNPSYRAMFTRAGVNPDTFDVGPQVSKLIELRRQYGYGREGWERYLDGVMGDANALISADQRKALVDFMEQREAALKAFSQEQRARVLDHMRARSDWNARQWVKANEYKKVGEVLDEIPEVGGIAPTAPPAASNPFRGDILHGNPHTDGTMGAPVTEHGKLAAKWQNFIENSMTDEEFGYVNDYTGSLYDPMNFQLRTGATLDRAMKDAVAGMDNAIRKSPPLGESRILARGIGDKAPFWKAIQEAASRASSPDDFAERLTAMIGQKVTDPGFVSSSLDYRIASKRFASQVGVNPGTVPPGVGYTVLPTFEIEGTAATRGIYVSGKRFGQDVSGFGDDEKEFVLARGTEFEIIGWRFVDGVAPGSPKGLVFRVRITKQPGFK